MSANPLETVNHFHTEYGFSPSQIFCQVTGKPIGDYSDNEFQSVLSLICESNDGADEAADDLALRIFGSMRPSLRWNKFRVETVAELRVSHPDETLAYLINRMFAPHNRLKGGVTPRHLEERIKAWKHIESWEQSDDTNTLMYMLLEIDAKMGLDVEQPPYNWQDFFNAESMKHRVEMLQGWYSQLMERWEKRIKAEEMQTKWMRHGNVLAKAAFRDVYMESQPLTQTAIKKAAKAADKQIFAEALYDVLGDIFDSNLEPKKEAPKPVVVPLKRVINPFARKA